MASITINGRIKKEIPFSWYSITLQQYIEFNERYGKEILRRVKYIDGNNYELAIGSGNHITKDDIDIHRSIDIEDLLDYKALAWYSFFSGHDLFSAEASLTDGVKIQFRLLERMLNDEEEELKIEICSPIEWNNEQWKFSDYYKHPSTEHNPERSFYELQTGREVFRSLSLLLKNDHWKEMLLLCAIFFRKVNEPFNKSVLTDERIEMMKELPMSTALPIYLFLKDSFYNANNLNIDFFMS